MPTYQYACTACDERLEVVQKFTDDPLTECPACQGRLRKIFSAVGVVFKGSGFYRTDSRSSSQGKSGSSSGGSGSSSGGSGSSSGGSGSTSGGSGSTGSTDSSNASTSGASSGTTSAKAESAA